VFLDINGVEIGESVDEALAHTASKFEIVSDLRRNLAADDDSCPTFHEVEGGADDVRVLTEEIGLWREVEDRIDCGEQAVLAWHVVGRGCDRSEWRPSQDEFKIIEPDEIGQVRVTARKLRDLDRARGLGEREMSAQVTGERFTIQVFARTNGCRVVR
jgi:hypothetical protein